MSGLVRVSIPRLLVWVVFTALAVTVYVVIVGGIVCITNERYGFGEYIADLKNVYKLLATAIVGALVHSVLPVLSRMQEGDTDG
jgi:hypothetical protein